jgi:hypothetical protein
MTHLSPAQIVDIAEGCADAASTAHAAACEACRSKADAVAEAMRIAGADPEPEPSPLFWPHLAARVGSAVRRERAPASAWRWWGARPVPFAAAALLVAAIGVGMQMRSGGPGGGAPAPGGAARVAADSSEDARLPGDAADDPSWMLVSDLSADVSVEEAEASGVLPAPGGAEKALLQLDAAERVELARILREEIGARGSLERPGPGV